MNLYDSRHPWSRLIRAARAVRPEQPGAAPHGFSTRVVALAWTKGTPAGWLLERIAFRAVGVAGLLAALSLILNYSTPATGGATDWRDEPVMLPADDVVVMVDLMD